MAGKNGGARPGAGRPPGRLNDATLAKQAAKEEAGKLLRELLLESWGPTVKAQIANAQGIQHFFLRDPDGKFVKIDDPAKIEVALNCGEEGSYYWIFTKDPSTQAFTALADRAFDKPSESVEVEHSGGIELTWRPKPSE